MKVVCDACHAKYQIPDERVAGRKLRIRCRKCGGAIMVRGDNGTGELVSAPSGSAPPSNGVEWHVSLDGEQHGPYLTDQMGGMLRAGQLEWDAYVWRESYADWKAASDSDTLVRAVVAAADDEPTAAVAAPTGPHAPVADDEIRSDEDDPTRMALSPSAEELRPVARTTFAARAASRTSQPPIGGSALSASQPSLAASYVPRPGSQPPMTASYVPRAASQPPMTASYVPRAASQPPVTASFMPMPMSQPQAYGGGDMSPFETSAPSVHTGERNEDSVLFAAQNLALSASTQPTPAPRAGYATAEGSGLIDIRALVALSRSNPNAPAANGTAKNGHSSNGNGSNGGYASNGGYSRESDAVLTLANQTGAFARLDSLRPLEAPSRGPNKAVPAAIFGGSLMIAAAVFFALYLSRPQAVAPVAAAAVVPSVGVVTPEPVVQQPAVAAPAAAEPAAPGPVAAAEPEPAAAAAEPAPSRAGAAREPVSKSGSKHPTRVATRSSKSDAEPAVAAPSKKDAAETKADGKKTPSIDDLLMAEKKGDAPKAEPKAAATPDDDLLATAQPAKPSGKSPSIDELLDGAVVAGKKAPAGASDAASAALPETPTRDQVLAAMHGVDDAVRACGEGQALESPSAQAAVTVAGATGKVSGVRVTGVQGAVGSCVARAVRGAVFPKFAKPVLTINFPYKLK